jgi:hypothetical protein
MRTLVAVGFLLLTVCLALAEQPKVVQTTISPQKASVGNSVKVTVEFTGKPSDIQKVYLVVRGYEYDTDPYPLKPAAKTDKNIWSVKEPVPYNAPAETYHLDINAMDKNGDEIVTKGFETNSSGKAGSVKLTVIH